MCLLNIRFDLIMETSRHEIDIPPHKQATEQNNRLRHHRHPRRAGVDDVLCFRAGQHGFYSHPGADGSAAQDEYEPGRVPGSQGEPSAEPDDELYLHVQRADVYRHAAIKQ